MTIMMVAITTTISQTHEVYADNKAKDLCSQYDGELNNGKCKIKMMKIKQIMKMSCVMTIKIQ
ncbi:MAG TPA: hypothetical protein VF222_10375 [Nitrososphaeraceae archaeon]